MGCDAGDDHLCLSRALFCEIERRHVKLPVFMCCDATDVCVCVCFLFFVCVCVFFFFCVVRVRVHVLVERVLVESSVYMGNGWC